MPIAVDKNTGYGGALVNQKYRPLQNPQILVGDAPTYAGLLTRRDQLLRNMALWPKPLRLAAPNWANMVAGEAGHNPPLVVVSSNRSNWIAEGIRASTRQLARLPAPYIGPSDLRALRADDGQGQSPPIYAPDRLGPAPNRNVYIVVHVAEYAEYRAALIGTGINVVGWEFQRRGRRKAAITGFGASRFAAIEFCKRLRARAAAAAGGVAPWDYAWLLDDNVVAFSNFPGYDQIENDLAAANVPQAAAGLHGGTVAETALTNQTWARNLVGYMAQPQPVPALPAHIAVGILQQAVLWNIDYLTTNNLNFGKTYFASAEDLSLGSYFDHTNRPYFFYNGISVRKEEVTYHDNGAGGQAVNAWRKGITKLIADAEETIERPPLNLMVAPVGQNDGGVQKLGRFVVNRVLPAAAQDIRQRAGDAGVQNNARSQAVEQLTSEAIALGLVNNAALTTTFSTAGQNAPEIVEVDKP